MCEKIEWKSFGFKRTCNKNNQLWKKEMISVTDLEKKIHYEQKVCYICKKEVSTDDDKNYQKVRGIVIILENIEELLTIFVI